MSKIRSTSIYMEFNPLVSRAIFRAINLKLSERFRIVEFLNNHIFNKKMNLLFSQCVGCFLGHASK